MIPVCCRSAACSPPCFAFVTVDAFRHENVDCNPAILRQLTQFEPTQYSRFCTFHSALSILQGLNLTTGIEFGQVTPAYWKQFAQELDRPDADAVFLSCGGIRALEVVQEIEDAIGKPVITSNQAQFWSCLRRAGIMDKLTGFGKIFQYSGSHLAQTT